MASEKISQLPSATTTSGNDLYPLVSMNANYSITFTALQAALAGAITPSQLPAITLTGDVTGSASGGSIPTSIASTLVTSKLLTGYTVGTNTPISATNSLLTAFGNIQAQLNAMSGSAITALTGDGTATGPGSSVFTLATVNTNVGSFGSSTAIPSFTVNAKGLITSASSSVVIAPAGTLTGTTLAANVVSSSLTSVGVITNGTWQGSVISPTYGGTGQTTLQGAINSLAGSTTSGQFLRGNGTNVVMSAIQVSDVPTLNQNTTGTSSNVTATSNSTLVTLSALSLPAAQVTGITGTALTGYVVGGNTPIAATDTILTAFEKLQGQINNTDLSAITSLTGDGTASGPGAATFTLATVNSNVGSFNLANVTVNAKGLVTAASAPTTTGTGAVVQANSAVLVTPNLGTPSSLILTNATGLPLTTGVAGTLPTGNGGTGNNSPYTAGSVIFAGAGGTSLINNSTNFWWDNTNFRLGIGTNAPDSPLTIDTAGSLLPAPQSGTQPMIHIGASAGNGTYMLVDAFNNTPQLVNRRADGTASAPTAVQSGDILGNLVYSGYGATSYQLASAAKIVATAAENFTDSTGAAYLSFYTRQSGNVGASTERVRIDQNGNLNVFNLTSSAPVVSSSSGLLSNGTINLASSSYVSGTLPIANGGTGQTTSAAARSSSGLNIDERTTVNAVSYTAIATDRYIGQTGTLTGPITITLPAASSVNPGQILVIQDESGSVSTTNYISVAPAGSNNLNGVNAAKTFRTAYQKIILHSDGSSNWYYTINGVAQGGTGNNSVPTNGQLLIGNGSSYNLSTLTAGNNIAVTNGSGSITVGLNGTVPVANGGTGVTSVTTTPTATSFAGWDANSNFSANEIIEGFTTITTSGATTTLTVGSSRYQYLTGTANQTIILPVVSTLANGFNFTIINASLGTITVNTSGGNLLQTMGGLSRLTLTCVNTAGGTGTASWNYTYNPANISYTSGSIPFGSSLGTLTQDNANLYWNDTNHYLGIGTNAPVASLDVGTGTVRTGQVLGSSGVPTIAYGAAAGTGPSTAALIGNQMAFYLQINTGTATATGTLFTITVPLGVGTYGAPPILIPQNVNAAAAITKLGVTLINNTSWSVNVFTSALAASTTFAWYVSCPAAF